jgi:hypothetical protein
MTCFMLKKNELSIPQLTAAICRSGLRLPVLVALEAGRPLAFLGSQFLWIAQPALDLILPHNAVSHLAFILEDPVALDDLITHLDLDTKAR